VPVKNKKKKKKKKTKPPTPSATSSASAGEDPPEPTKTKKKKKKKKSPSPSGSESAPDTTSSTKKRGRGNTGDAGRDKKRRRVAVESKQEEEEWHPGVARAAAEKQGQDEPDVATVKEVTAEYDSMLNKRLSAKQPYGATFEDRSLWLHDAKAFDDDKYLPTHDELVQDDGCVDKCLCCTPWLCASM
jgi:hypothetical protein